MLSTSYRVKLEKICERIATHQEVSLQEIIWCEKLAAHNAHAAKFLRQARRKAENPEMTEDSLDGFLNALDIGGIGNERHGISGFNGADDIVDFFKEDRPDDWRQRD